MRGFSHSVAEFWRDRHAWAWPPLLAMGLMLANSLSLPDMYRAQTTLQLDVSEARSPLLQNWQSPGHEAVLDDILRRPDLLADSARDGGQSLNPRGLALHIISDRLLTITYASPQREGLESALDALAFNFIYELLAPERLRLQQRLQTLAEQIGKVEQHAANQAANQAEYGLDTGQPTPSTPTDIERLRKTYNDLLASLGSVNAAFDKGAPNALIWFAEPAHLLPMPSPAGRHIQDAVTGFLAGLLISMVWVTLRRGRRAALATQENVAAITGLPLLGQLPNLGYVKMSKGMVEVNVGGTFVQPSGFAEIVRLHRLLTRNLKGSLVLVSTDGGEGTSLLAQLLAIRSAITAKKVLLVDLNLKNTHLTRLNGAKPDAWKLGSKTQAWKELVIPLGDSGVDFLPAPSDPATLKELATVAGARAWLDKADSSYEHIILDTSALGALNRNNADPTALAAAATRAALVVLTGTTTRRRLATATPQLLASGAQVIGVVANTRHDPAHAELARQAFAFLNNFIPGLGTFLTHRAGV